MYLSFKTVIYLKRRVSIPFSPLYTPYVVSCFIADIELVVCDKPNCVKKLLDHKKNTPRLRVIVHVEVVPEEEVKRAKSLGVDLIRFADLEVS